MKNTELPTSSGIVRIFFTMNQHQTLLTSSLRDAIEADFLDITRKHLRFWNENIHLLDKDKLSSQSTSHEANHFIHQFRSKRSGLQKILQVLTNKNT